nr:hypothetical protein BaRGS_015670 [Batillaria attramentaria]
MEDKLAADAWEDDDDDNDEDDDDDEDKDNDENDDDALDYNDEAFTMNDHKGTWPSPDIVYTDMYVYRNYSDPAWSHQPDRPITWFTTTQRPTYHDSYMPVTTTTTIPSSSTLADIDQCDLSNQMPYPDVTQLPWVVTFLTVVYLIIMVLSICGNALVILTVWRNSHMHTVTNYYIVNLAVSDLLVSVLVMPLKLLEYISPCAWNVFGNPVLCPILYYILPIFVFASVLTLVAISLER